MANETQVQELVHRLEEGRWKKWVLFGALLSIVIYVAYAWLFKENGFKGLAHPRAMEQAVIARELARGHGFSTTMLRPAELWLFEANKSELPKDYVPDTYHAPLWPTICAPAISLVKRTWEMTVKETLYESDRIIVSVALIFFFLSVAVNFFLARRLFDVRLALFGVCLMLLCDQFWQYSMSGLPQMLLLFLFSCAMYVLVLLLEARQRDKAREDFTAAVARREGALVANEEQEELPDEPEPEARPWLTHWVLPAVLGLIFGLLALSHALTIWILVGVLIFSVFYFRPRWRTPVILVAMFLLVYSPWLVRNAQVCGNPFGVSWYAGLYQIRGTQDMIMRSMEPALQGVSPSMFRAKVQNQALLQIGSLPKFLGYTLVALAFFICLLHQFKRPVVSHFRWALFLMWVVALFGMCVFGFDDLRPAANDLHVLFIPLFSFYGFAFILLLWSRWEMRVRLVQIGFIGFLYFICSLPFLNTLQELHRPAGSRVNWPPYVPPFIAVMRTWTEPNEIITSDMPWAVAWYADRKSLWLPSTTEDYLKLNDYNGLKAPLVGLYLTPVSADEPFISQIMNGEYKPWWPFITRSANLAKFPLKAVTPLPIDNRCIFYADRDRWTLKED